MTLAIDTSWNLVPDDPHAAIPLVREYLGRLALLAAETQAGAVTSVQLSGPAIFAFPAAPATGAASITFSLATQAQNLVWASPNGSNGTPTFRALVKADLPTLTASDVGAAPAFTNQAANVVYAGPSSGGSAAPAFRALVIADLPATVARTDQANSLTGTQTVTGGNLALATAGKGVQVKEGSNARLGQATLAAGSVTVANTSVTASTRILLTVATPGGTQGHLSYALNAGVGFTITSTSATETSTVTWMLVEAL